MSESNSRPRLNFGALSMIFDAIELLLEMSLYSTRNQADFARMNWSAIKSNLSVNPSVEIQTCTLDDFAVIYDVSPQIFTLMLPDNIASNNHSSSSNTISDANLVELDFVEVSLNNDAVPPVVVLPASKAVWRRDEFRAQLGLKIANQSEWEKLSGLTRESLRPHIRYYSNSKGPLDLLMKAKTYVKPIYTGTKLSLLKQHQDETMALSSLTASSSVGSKRSLGEMKELAKTRGEKQSQLSDAIAQEHRLKDLLDQCGSTVKVADSMKSIFTSHNRSSYELSALAKKLTSDLRIKKFIVSAIISDLVSQAPAYFSIRKKDNVVLTDVLQINLSVSYPATRKKLLELMEKRKNEVESQLLQVQKRRDELLKLNA